MANYSSEQASSMFMILKLKYLLFIHKARAHNGDKNQVGRTGVKCVKRKPNKSGGPDKVDLLVLIDLVIMTSKYINNRF